MNLQIPDVIPGDWTRMALIIRQIRRSLGTQAVPTLGSIILDDLTASQLVATDASKKLVSLAVPLVVAKGGTGAATLTDHGILLGSGTDAITPLGVATDGQIPIGSSDADPVLATITGTTNRVTVSNTAGGITLTAPQDLHTGAFVAFAKVTINNIIIDQSTIDGVEFGTIRNSTGALALNDEVGDAELLIGNDTNTTDDNERGIRVHQRDVGDMFLDFKTYSTKTITFRCGEGAETGATHSWMTVDPTEGYVDFPGTVTTGALGCGEITVADGSSINLQEAITFTGATTENLIEMPDHLADALSIKEGANAYLTFVTTNAGEKITLGKKLEAGAVEIEGSAFDINGGTLAAITIDGNWTATGQTCADLGTATVANITNLGISGAADSARGIYVHPTSSTATYSGVDVNFKINPSAAGQTGIGMIFTVLATASAEDMAGLIGVTGSAGADNTGYTGTVTYAAGVQSAVANAANGSTFTRAYLFYGSAMTAVLGGVISTAYGLYLPDISAGGTNWAIYCAGGDSYHVGDLAFGQVDKAERIGSDADGTLDLYAGTSIDLHQATTIGDGGTTNYTAFSAAGVQTMAGTAKVKQTTSFTFHHNKITAQGAPDRVVRGVFEGWSLPIWSDPANLYEELVTCECMLHEWDGTTDPIIYIGGWLDTANTSKRFNLQVAVETADFANNDVVPATTNNYSVETLTGTWAQYTSFKVQVTIDASAIGLAVGQPLTIRIRRIAKTGVEAEIAGEVVVEGAAVEITADKLGGAT